MQFADWIYAIGLALNALLLTSHRHVFAMALLALAGRFSNVEINGTYIILAETLKVPSKKDTFVSLLISKPRQHHKDTRPNQMLFCSNGTDGCFLGR